MALHRNLAHPRGHGSLGACSVKRNKSGPLAAGRGGLVAKWLSGELEVLARCQSLSGFDVCLEARPV